MSFISQNVHENLSKLHHTLPHGDRFSDKNHSAVGKISTELYVWGSDEHGQLGLGHKYLKEGSEKFLKGPKSCSFSIQITDIACGEDFAFLLTSKGHLYGMGSNQFGKLGLSISQSSDQGQQSVN